MNLFLIDKNILECVVALCDKHCVKMILETCQVLYACWHVRSPLPDHDPTIAPYRKTHVNHPISIWVRHNESHYNWTCNYGLALCAEYTRRYGKIHKTQYHLERLQSWGYPPKVLPDVPIKKKTKEWVYARKGIPSEFEYFPLCMDESSYTRVNGEYHAVASYKNYYQSKNDKIKMEWRHTEKPTWFVN